LQVDVEPGLPLWSEGGMSVVMSGSLGIWDESQRDREKLGTNLAIGKTADSQTLEDRMVGEGGRW
jgi:hypothetical protein